MLHQLVPIFVKIDIRGVGDVIPFALEKAHHEVFPCEEISSSMSTAVRTVEGYLSRGSLDIGVVEGLTTPSVVGLVGIHAGLKQQIRFPLAVPHNKVDVTLLTRRRTSQLGQVHPTC